MAAPASGFNETAKAISLMLTAVSGLAYACGYLARRARAHALGFDPGFSLVDEAYVFAGFRVVCLTLLALLITAPLLFALRLVARALGINLPPGARTVAEYFAALALALATLCSFFLTLMTRDALLTPAVGRLSTVFRNAVLDGNGVGVAMTLVVTMLAVCAGYWVWKRYAVFGADPLALLLGTITAALLALLPLLHGVFWADRIAGTLERVPDGLGDAASSVWLVDRGGDRVVVLIRDAVGKLKLVTLQADKLNGIGTTGTRSLGEIVKRSERP